MQRNLVQSETYHLYKGSRKTPQFTQQSLEWAKKRNFTKGDGYGVGVDVAKDCKHDFRGFYSDRYYTWTEGELEDCFKKIKEKYNYVPDSEDKKLLVDYALDIINVKKYIKQGFSNEEISNEIKLSVEDIRKIRYEEVTIHVYFREQVVVEVRL